MINRTVWSPVLKCEAYFTGLHTITGITLLYITVNRVLEGSVKGAAGFYLTRLTNTFYNQLYSNTEKPEQWMKTKNKKSTQGLYSVHSIVIGRLQ